MNYLNTCQLSRYSYDGRSIPDGFVCRAEIARRNSSAVVLDSGSTDDLFVVFRGSGAPTIDGRLDLDALADWIDNANYSPREVAAGHCPDGFWNHLDRIYDGVIRTILGLSRDQELPRVHLVGHSLGGACATLAALRIATEGNDIEVASIATIGSPGCCDADLSRVYATHGLAAVADHWQAPGDPVPHLPPGNWLHPGRVWTWSKGFQGWTSLRDERPVYNLANVRSYHSVDYYERLA